VLAQWIVSTPQMQHLGPLFARQIQEWGLDFARSAWHNPALITDEIWQGYIAPLQVADWDRALWELTVASRANELAERLDELTIPVLVITGDDDRIVPTAQSERLAQELPMSALTVIPNCGHVAHEECPQPTLTAIEAFLASIE
jgi:pimeloyl-ACP methyl ester carboxylesterase